MAEEWIYESDQTGSQEKAKGGDGRGNVDARSAPRAYFNSRDKGQTYSMPFDFQNAAAGEFGAYLKNTNTNNQVMVIDGIGINSAEASRIKLWYVTGTAAGGGSVVPTQLNSSSSNAASAIGMEGASAATGITGLSTGGLIDFAYVTATGHEEFRLKDRLRLGQNAAIGLEYDEGTGGDFSGVIYFFLENKGNAT